MIFFYDITLQHSTFFQLAAKPCGKFIKVWWDEYLWNFCAWFINIVYDFKKCIFIRKIYKLCCNQVPSHTTTCLLYTFNMNIKIVPYLIESLNLLTTLTVVTVLGSCSCPYILLKIFLWLSFYFFKKYVLHNFGVQTIHFCIEYFFEILKPSHSSDALVLPIVLMFWWPFLIFAAKSIRGLAFWQKVRAGGSSW